MYATLVSSGGTGHRLGTSDRNSIESTLTFWFNTYFPSLSLADSSISNTVGAAAVVLDDACLVRAFTSPEFRMLFSILTPDFFDSDIAKVVTGVGSSFLTLGSSSSESRSSITSSLSRLLLGGLSVTDKARFFEMLDGRACLASSCSGSESLEISMMSCPAHGIEWDEACCVLRRNSLSI